MGSARWRQPCTFSFLNMKQLLPQLLLAGLGAAGSLGAARAQCQLQFDPIVWTQVYRDDFNQLDRTEWDTSPDHNTNINAHGGWGSEWYDFNDPSLVTIRQQPNSTNKVLVLTAKRWLDAYGNPVEDSVLNDTQKGTYRPLRYRSGMLISADNPGDYHSKQTSYGAWEARIKCPTNPNAWPAFWLWSGSTEIDILDGISPDSTSPAQAVQNNVIDNLWKKHSASTNPQPNLESCGAKLKAWSALGQPLSTKFSDDYHVYTMVWTPDFVTFFFDGRETNTVPRSAVITRNDWPEIRLSLQMLPWVGKCPGCDPNETAEMYVDWVRVLKPNVIPGQPDYGHPYFSNYSVATNTFKTSSEFLNRDITALATTSSKVNATAGSITTNPNKAGQVFYRGTDNLLYVATQQGTTWTVDALPVPPLANIAVQGDVVYHQANNLVLYRGADACVQGYQFNGSTW